MWATLDYVERIIMDLKIYQTGPLEVNTCVLTDSETKEAVLIDVGGCFSDIKSQIDKEGYSIKYVLNTHGHFDHVTGDAEIQELCPDIPIFMNKKDIPHVENLTAKLLQWGFKSDVKTPVISNFIDETSNLYIGKNKITILYTPGHSQGSLSYYTDGKLFCGDTLFYRSIGRTDFSDGDYDTLLNSIKTKLLTLPDNTVVYPGHGPSTTILNEKNYNTYLRSL
ncbi:MAG: MBL fold metallo-hydrolase [Candidatus Gastranaerophilales bacterium]|nr:MBL fold metallo-hydrolase [Candidatus Gastranaerophilales bacterium]